jgi:hypothetical protein
MQFTTDLEIKGSNPAAVCHLKKMVGKCFFLQLAGQGSAVSRAIYY